MTTRQRRLLLSLLAGLSTSAAASTPALAQDPAAAEVLYERGMADWKAGKITEGCKAIAESHRLDPRPGTLFTLATCQKEAGRVATAWALFGEYLGLYDRLPADVRARQGQRPGVARTERADLEPKMAKLTILLAPGAPPGTLVKRHGLALSEASLGLALPTDPGEEVVSVEAPGLPPREVRVTLAAGEKRTVTVAPAPPAAAVPPPAPPAPSQEGPSARRIAAYVTGGVGILGGVIGAATGAVVLGRKGTLNAHCGAAVRSADPAACDPTGLDAASGLAALGAVSTLGVVLGVAGVGTAIGLFASEPRPATPRAGAAVSFGLLSAGPGGAVIGARGAF